MVDSAWFRWLRWCRVIGTAAFSVLVWAAPARASDPFAFYSVPSKVELLPDDAGATRVIIHGALFKLLTTPMTYGQPVCGVVHFSCKAGEETMCRMQWKEIRDAVSAAPMFCTGFGAMSMVSSTTIHAEGAPVGSPDPWDLGVGVNSGAYVDYKCPAALALKCGARSPPDDSAQPGGDGGSRAPVGGTGGTTGGTGGAAGGGTGSNTGAGTGGAPMGGAGGAVVPAASSSSGCAVAGGALPLAPGLIVGTGGVLVAAAARRRRRRR